ncbi:hypothetical protein ACQ4LE_007401 [Meloidogyne hapla]|uniref:RRM domain-containing protein n=1 Tax=Meloidogyne hapla TaxID=6305 RepID=A0A1I8B0E2_MELHA
MEEENEQLDYDELDDLEVARKKCKELQKAVEIDNLQAVQASSTEKIEDNLEILAPTSNALQQQIKSAPLTSQNHSSTFPPGTQQFAGSIFVSSAPISSIMFSSNTPPPPGVSTVPIISSSSPPPLTSNIPRPSLQQQHHLTNKFYVNPKFNNNKSYFKRNDSKSFYKKFAMPPPTVVGNNFFPSLPMTSQIRGSTIQLAGGTFPMNNQSLHVPHGLGANTLGLPLTMNPHLGNVSTSSATSFLQPTSGNNIYINRSVLQTTNSWNAMVDEFVRKNVSSDIRSRHYIPYLKQSRSRSSSSSTSRRSNSSSSASSNISAISRNRSCSITDDSTNNDYSKRRRIEVVEEEMHHSRRRYSKNDDNGQQRSKKGFYKDVRDGEEETIVRNQAVECARALGLDEDYLKKIEEQQRLRDELLRRKTQKRKEKEAAIKGMEILDRKSSKTDGLTKDKETDKNKEESKHSKQQRHSSINLSRKSTNKTSKTSEQIKEKDETNKLRPYLAVVCTNLRGISSVEKKIGALAAVIGKTKKIWRVGADDCHIIFEKHEHAKQFMLQYYGKKLGNAPATRIDVALKKVFLNISSHAD